MVVSLDIKYFNPEFIYPVIINDTRNMIKIKDKVCGICQDEHEYLTHYSCHITHKLCIDCWLRYNLNNTKKCCYCRKENALRNDTIIFY